MNTKRIFGIGLAVALVVFMIAPIASAQVDADILDGQWFKVTASLKGYEISGDTVLGNGTIGGTVYLHTTYTTGQYTITTCTQDKHDDNVWHKIDTNTISIVDIYGATYPQVWDFGDKPVVFSDGPDTYSAYPTLYTKITVDPKSNLKSATISTVSCSAYGDLDNGNYITGSCTLKGSLVPATQVTKKVPSSCLQ